MTLANANGRNLKDLSMIEIAVVILEDSKKALNYRDLFDQVAEIKGYKAAQKKANLAQFYTDLNLDGRILTLGGGDWGLKKWYSVDQIDEVITVEVKTATRKKAKPKKKEIIEDDYSGDDDDDLTEVPLDILKRKQDTEGDDEEDTLILDEEEIIDDEDYDEFDEDYDDEEEDEEDEDDDL